MSILEKLKKDAGSTQGINCGVMLTQNGLSRSLKSIDIVLCQSRKLEKLCHELEMEFLRNTNIKKYNKMVEDIEAFGVAQKYRKRLNIEQVRQVRSMRKDGCSVDSIAEAFGVSVSTVSSITIWIRYPDVDPELKESYMKSYGVKRFRAYGGDIVKAIREMIGRGHKRGAIAKKLGISPLIITKAMSNARHKPTGEAGSA